MQYVQCLLTWVFVLAVPVPRQYRRRQGTWVPAAVWGSMWLHTTMPNTTCMCTQEVVCRSGMCDCRGALHQRSCTMAVLLQGGAGHCWLHMGVHTWICLVGQQGCSGVASASLRVCLCATVAYCLRKFLAHACFSSSAVSRRLGGTGFQKSNLAAA